MNRRGFLAALIAAPFIPLVVELKLEPKLIANLEPDVRGDIVYAYDVKGSFATKVGEPMDVKLVVQQVESRMALAC